MLKGCREVAFFHENALFLKKVAKKFGHIKKKQYFCTRFQEQACLKPFWAEAASPI